MNGATGATGATGETGLRVPIPCSSTVLHPRLVNLSLFWITRV